MNRTEELMKMKGAELIKIADSLKLTINTNKERTQLKAAKAVVVAAIIEAEARIEALKKHAEKSKKPAQRAQKMTDEEKRAKRAERYAAKKAKREEIMQGRCAKTETFTFNGKEQTLTEWSKELGILRKTLYRRIYYYGWTVEEAFAQ